MMLKSQLYVTGINYILKYIKIENSYLSCEKNIYYTAKKWLILLSIFVLYLVKIS